MIRKWKSHSKYQWKSGHEKDSKGSRELGNTFGFTNAKETHIRKSKLNKDAEEDGKLLD